MRTLMQLSPALKAHEADREILAEIDRDELSGGSALKSDRRSLSITQLSAVDRIAYTVGSASVDLSLHCSSQKNPYIISMTDLEHWC